MKLLSSYTQSLRDALDDRVGYNPPPLVGTYWGTALFVGAFLVASILAAGDKKIYYQFLEGHSVTALSSAFMAMTCALAWGCHLSQPSGPRAWSKWFWPAFSFAFLFFSLDEILEFHEQAGEWLKKAVGPAETLRNWNDGVVIGYGLVALVAIAVFLPEILRYPKFAEILGGGFAFFSLHTLIDSTMTSRQHILEESAKLIATALFALAALTVMMTLRRGDGDGAGDGRGASDPD